MASSTLAEAAHEATVWLRRQDTTGEQ